MNITSAKLMPFEKPAQIDQKSFDHRAHKRARLNTDRTQTTRVQKEKLPRPETKPPETKPESSRPQTKPHVRPSPMKDENFIDRPGAETHPSRPHADAAMRPTRPHAASVRPTPPEVSASAEVRPTVEMKPVRETVAANEEKPMEPTVKPAGPALDQIDWAAMKIKGAAALEAVAPDSKPDSKPGNAALGLGGLNALTTALYDHLSADGFAGKPPTNIRDLIDSLDLTPRQTDFMLGQLAKRYPSGLGVNMVG